MDKPRGFAALSPERQKEISSLGGKAVPAGKRQGFSSLSAEQRRTIGSAGGKAVPAEKRSFSRDPKLAAEAGRKGGLAARKSKGGLGDG